jgi:glycosyltransferase involved in cell wall biosynthesis
MTRILFVHNHPTHFVKLDLEILRERFDVTELFLSSRRITPLAVWRQVARHDVIFGWFASWHTFLTLLFAKLLRKPSVLIIGGYDLANMPEIGYGHLRGGVTKWVSQWTIRMATQLVTNSYYSQEEAGRNANVLKDDVQVVYHGLPDPYGAIPQNGRGRMALTVGNVCQENLWRKGHEPFVRAAALLPDVEFVLVGDWQDGAIERLRGIATPNVTFTGWVDEATLLGYYRRAAVYVQPSSHEGFGMSLAEAMLAGCVPLVTRAGAIPEVVSDCGIYITPQAEVIAQSVEEALALQADARLRARTRILDCFPLRKRQQAFEQLICGLADKAAGPRPPAL